MYNFQSERLQVHFNRDFMGEKLCQHWDSNPQPSDLTSYGAGHQPPHSFFAFLWSLYFPLLSGHQPMGGHWLAAVTSNLIQDLSWPWVCSPSQSICPLRGELAPASESRLFGVTLFSFQVGGATWRQQLGQLHDQDEDRQREGFFLAINRFLKLALNNDIAMSSPPLCVIFLSQCRIECWRTLSTFSLFPRLLL